jgi:hypothetical protein
MQESLYELMSLHIPIDTYLKQDLVPVPRGEATFVPICVALTQGLFCLKITSNNHVYFVIPTFS